ncbi:coiled-coil domain-containing protein [Thermococcus barophilus]|nr:hypothetical protein [Thermococcus barophilus]
MEVIVLIAITIALAYYVRDKTNAVVSQYFDLRQRIESHEEKTMETINSFRKQLDNLVGEINRLKNSLGQLKNLDESAHSWKIKQISEKISQLEKKIKNQERINTKLTYELGSLEQKVSRIEAEFENLKEDVASSLREDILRDLQEEIEKLEELIENRKDRELKEFLEMLTAAISLEPETVQKGLLDIKKGILSLRDLAKVYVLTGKGVEKFNELRDSLVKLLRNMRKLAVISVPEDEVYSKFNDIIVRVKRLELPMKIQKEDSQKELTPEKSFIRIHKETYGIIQELEDIAKLVNTPIPVTPIEKEFYDKLKEQFEELKKLEDQINQLMLRINKSESSSKSQTREDEIEKLLKELNL